MDALNDLIELEKIKTDLIVAYCTLILIQLSDASLK